jgi:Uma2 family endonuclease
MIALRKSIETLAELQRQLGDIPASRIRFRPVPGAATEKDILDVQRKTDRLCELVDGTLVEKAMGYQESFLGIRLAVFLDAFITPRKLGLLAGSDGMLKLAEGLVRIPDVSFISWDRLPERKVPKAPIPALAPNLAVEILSASNTIAEMKRKLREYFKAGVSLVWIIDPEARTVAVYTSPKNPRTLDESQTLDGGDVLPGFELNLHTLFAELDLVAPE